MNKILIASLFTCSLAVASHSAGSSQSNGSDTEMQRPDRDGPRPPREIFEKMIAACRGKKIGDRCSVQVESDKSVRGQCAQDDHGTKICDIPPPPGDRQAPPRDE